MKKNNVFLIVALNIISILAAAPAYCGTGNILNPTLQKRFKSFMVGPESGENYEKNYRNYSNLRNTGLAVKTVGAATAAAGAAAFGFMTLPTVVGPIVGFGSAAAATSIAVRAGMQLKKKKAADIELAPIKNRQV